MIIDENETIEISKKLYEKLLDDSLTLKLLYKNGVKNWDGYEECFNNEI